MRSILSIIFLFVVSCAYSQYGNELQLTETKFALESQVHGLKWGFLHNMDTGALGMGPQGYLNLYKSWEARPENANFTLLWKPAIVFWSDDGLFGLTTGPYYAKNNTDSILPQSGNFFSIWKREKISGPYKFVLDIGVSLSEPAPANLTKDVNVQQVRISSKPGKAVANAPAAQGSIRSFISNFANNQSCILVDGYGMLTKSNVEKAIKLSGKDEFTRIGSRQLSASCYYEWGTLPNGYFVHVWNVQAGKPVLLAAVYHIR